MSSSANSGSFQPIITKFGSEVLLDHPKILSKFHNDLFTKTQMRSNGAPDHGRWRRIPPSLSLLSHPLSRIMSVSANFGSFQPIITKFGSEVPLDHQRTLSKFRNDRFTKTQMRSNGAPDHGLRRRIPPSLSLLSLLSPV